MQHTKRPSILVRRALRETSTCSGTPPLLQHIASSSNICGRSSVDFSTSCGTGGRNRRRNPSYFPTRWQGAGEIQRRHSLVRVSIGILHVPLASCLQSSSLHLLLPPLHSSGPVDTWAAPTLHCLVSTLPAKATEVSRSRQQCSYDAPDRDGRQHPISGKIANCCD